MTGTGDGGRIIKKDVEEAIEKGKSAPVTTPAASQLSLGAEDQSIPVTQMRKVIAKRLGESKFTSPHNYVTAEIDMDNDNKARKTLNEGEDERISFNDMIIKAAEVKHQQQPIINNTTQDNQ